MKVNAVIAIVIALMITVLLFAIYTYYSFNLSLAYIFPFIIGGIIATGLAERNKIIYSLYYGLISAVILSLIILTYYNVITIQYSSIEIIIGAFILLPILAVIGGSISKIVIIIASKR